ncbi:MAG: molybdenum cofactor biosynthesis protein B [Gammaproteobacteria bacterium]|nr:MAG: molybdenum cofactor biosynthesis protein B [Gammaproteobacteria bacterium]
MAGHAAKAFAPLNIAVLTVSDTRTFETDSSGDLLEKKLTEAGHNIAGRAICIDDIYQLRAVVSNWVASNEVQAILVTGGTGFTTRDTTPEALIPLFDKPVEGFGELFRSVSFDEIGSSTIQSRAIAGMANQTVIFCMPGSPGACATAWDKILVEQLDASHRPCNFVMHLKATAVEPCETRG